MGLSAAKPSLSHADVGHDEEADLDVRLPVAQMHEQRPAHVHLLHVCRWDRGERLTSKPVYDVNPIPRILSSFRGQPLDPAVVASCFSSLTISREARVVVGTHDNFNETCSFARWDVGVKCGGKPAHDAVTVAMEDSSL